MNAGRFFTIRATREAPTLYRGTSPKKRSRPLEQALAHRVQQHGDHSQSGSRPGVHGQVGGGHSVVPAQGDVVQPSEGREFGPCYKVGEPEQEYAPWSKPVTKGQVLHDPTTLRGRQIHRDGE